MTKSILAFALAAAASTPAFAATTYEIDPTHAAALFKVSHIGYSYTWGRFNDISGTITWGDDAKEVKVVIKTESVDTGTVKKDEHLRSGDFFSAKEFPEMTFTASKVEDKGDNLYHVTGTFSLHGVSKEITVPVIKMAEGKDPWGKTRIGFDATFTIKRSDFGMTYMPEGIGDEVTIVFAVEAVAG